MFWHCLLSQPLCRLAHYAPSHVLLSLGCLVHDRCKIHRAVLLLPRHTNTTFTRKRLNSFGRRCLACPSDMNTNIIIIKDPVSAASDACCRHAIVTRLEQQQSVAALYVIAATAAAGESRPTCRYGKHTCNTGTGKAPPNDSYALS